jgi:hypothetical protein
MVVTPVIVLSSSVVETVSSSSESGGLVHARNKYNTESVFVLEHAGTPKHTVTVACQVVAYQE